MTPKEWLDLRVGDKILIPPCGYNNYTNQHPLFLTVSRRGEGGFQHPNVFPTLPTDSIHRYLEANLDDIQPPESITHHERDKRFLLMPDEVEFNGNNIRSSWMGTFVREDTHGVS